MKALRIACAVPLFVVGIDDVLRHRKNHVIVRAHRFLGVHDDIPAMRRVPAHFDEFVRRERSWLVQQSIGHTHLAGIVKWGEARKQIDSLWCQIIAELRISGELLGENPGIPLRAPRMLAGFRIPDLGERQQRLNHQSL